MKLLKLAFRRETAMPMYTLIFASAVSLGLVVARIFWTGHVRYAFLGWNLFLAWLPLVFAMLARDTYEQTSGRNWRFFAWAGAWLLFFPNAPYIFTDVIHLTRGLYRHFWVDLVLILSCALTGLVLGFLSLYLMHSVAKRMIGRWFSWMFIAAVAGLSGFGIYIGRFLRLNSWDIVLRPVKLYHSVGSWVKDPFAHSTSYAFPVLFAAFLFISYVMLYGLTSLQLQTTPSTDSLERPGK